MFSSFLSAYITAFEPVLRICCCSWGFRNWKIPAVNLEGTPFHSASVPKETSRDLKHLLMGLLQRNHRERISFGKPLSRIYERICFRVWLLNLVLFFFLHSQKSFFTIRSWRQVHPQRNVGMRPCCVQSSVDSGRVLLQISTCRFLLSPQLPCSLTQVPLQPVPLVAPPRPIWPPLRWVFFILLYTYCVCVCAL